MSQRKASRSLVRWYSRRSNSTKLYSAVSATGLGQLDQSARLGSAGVLSTACDDPSCETGGAGDVVLISGIATDISLSAIHIGGGIRVNLDSEGDCAVASTVWCARSQPV